jgi:hypothetical protein
MVATSSCGIVEFEVLTAEKMKSTMFWDVTPCDPLEVYRLFGGTVCLLPTSCWLLV